MEYSEKQVYFDKYCPTCQNAALDENKDPCNECLTYPVNTNTHVPVLYKEKNNG